MYQEDVGEIGFNSASVKDELGHHRVKYGGNYTIEDNRVSAVKVVDSIIRESRPVYYDRNHKTKAWDTVTLAAKIRIEGADYYTLATVKINEKNNVYRFQFVSSEIREVSDGNEKEGVALTSASRSVPSLIHDGSTGIHNTLHNSSIFDLLLNYKGEDESGMKYQLDITEPVEETRTLVAVHNLTADKLQKTLGYEGIPMPSIAVTKADMGWDNFGDISLVFRKDTIDPKANEKNKVYGADAWTATFPKIDYKIDSEKADKVSSEFNRYRSGLPDYLAQEARNFVYKLQNNAERFDGYEGMVSEALDNIGMKAAYMKSLGEEVENRTYEERTELSEGVKAKYEAVLEEFDGDADMLNSMPLEDIVDRVADAYARGAIDAGADTEVARKQASRIRENRRFAVSVISKITDYARTGGVKVETVTDEGAMRRDVEARVNDADYEAWLRRNLEGIEIGTGVWNGKDYLTPSGNRRSFDQLHYPVTAENIVRSMLAGSKDAKNTVGFFGAKSVRAVAAGDFSSVEQMHAAEDRIVDMTEAEFEAIEKDLNERLTGVIQGIVERTGATSYEAADHVGKIILNAARRKRITKESVKKEFAKYPYWKVTDQDAAVINDLIHEIADMPVNMFEAKPQRVVGYDEIAAAVLPNNVAPELVEQLQDRGVAVEFYDPGKEKDRVRAVQSLEGIRFQLDLAEENSAADLSEENANLKKANAYLTNMLQTYKDMTPSRRDINRVAQQMIEKYHSKASKKDVADKVERLYTYMRTARNVDGGEVSNVAASIAREVIDKATYTMEEEQKQYDDLRTYLRGKRIYIPESIRDDLNGENGYNEWRKRYFGRINFTTDQSKGVEVDKVYEEMLEMFPGALGQDVYSSADRAQEIANLLERTVPKEISLYGADSNELAYLLSQDIMDAYFGVGNEDVRTTYNKTYKAMMSEVESKILVEYQREVDRITREHKGEMFTFKQAQMAAADERFRAKRDRFLDNQDRAVYKRNIMKDAQKLLKMVAQPTDREHVPEAMKTDLLNVLQYIDFSSNRVNQEGNPTQRSVQAAEFKASVMGLIKSINDIEKADGVYSDGTGEQIYMTVDPDLASSLSQIAGMFAADESMHENIDNLSTYNLKTIRDSLASIKNMVTLANRMIANEQYETIRDIGDHTLEELAERKTKKDPLAGKYFKDMLTTGMLDSYTFLRDIGPTGLAIYDEIRGGLDKKIQNTKVAVDFMMGLREKYKLTDKIMNNWAKKVVEFDVFGDNKIRTTAAHVMALYELDKREAARRHLYADASKNQSHGGFKMRQTRDGWKGYTDEIRYKLTPEGVKHLTDQLTSEQKAVADAIGRFMTEELGEMGNEVTMRLYGYRKFTAKDYFPIVVDKTTVSKNSQAVEAGMTMLKNMGATKSVNQYASNPLIVENIFEVFTRHADQMGSYNAFMIPVSDTMKWYNYKGDMSGVQTEIKRTMGTAANEYIMNLIRDLNGARTQASRYDRITLQLTGAMKSAAVGGNLRVVIQQPTSVVRAAIEMNPTYLLKGLVMTPTQARQQWELCKKYAPIAQWKEWGYFEINVGRSMNDLILGTENNLEKAKELSMAGAGWADQWAWVRMWKAAQLQVADQNKDLERGSEAFYREAGKVFSHIIDTTQVVDSVLHRSDMMKDKSANVKAVISFMSEPMKTWNMLYRAMSDLKLQKPGSKARAYRTAVVYIASAALTSAAASIISALRDPEKDKKYGTKWLDAFVDDALGNIVIVNSVPYIRDIMNLLQGYDVEDTQYTTISNLIDAVSETVKFAKGESKYAPAGLLYAHLSDAASITGFPLKNIMRDTGALIDTILNATGNQEGQYIWQRLQYNPGAKNSQGTYTNRSMYINSAMRAYASGNQELGDKIMQEMVSAGIDEDKIQSSIRNKIADEPEVAAAAQAFLDGDTEALESYRKQLIDKGYHSDTVDAKIDSAVEKLCPYTYGEVGEAYVSGSDNRKQMYEQLVEFREKTGKSKKEVIGSIKSAITTKYKPEYRAADAKGKQEMKKRLYGIMIDGVKLYEEKDFKSWDK